MAQVLPFPTPDDRQTVLAAMQYFLLTGNPASRLRMLMQARKILDRYRVSHLHMRDFIIRTAGRNMSAIEAMEVVSGNACPRCGADIYSWPWPVRIVYISEGVKEDIVTYGCRCGKVFIKKEAVN